MLEGPSPYLIAFEKYQARPISHLRLTDQDKIDSELLGLTKTGVGVRGQWLENAIRRILSESPDADLSSQLVERLTH